MFVKRRRASQTGSTIFPFLSVLFCTIGVMMLILVAGSLKMTFKEVDLPEKMAAQAQTLEDLKANVERANKRLAKAIKERGRIEERAKDAIAKATELARETSEHEAALASVARGNDDASQGLADKTFLLEGLAADTLEILAIPEKISIIRKSQDAAIARDETSRERDGLDSDARKLRADAESLRAEASQMSERLAALKRIAGSPVARFKVRGAGAEKPPVYVELDKGSVTVHTNGLSAPAGTIVTKAKALGEKGFLAGLAAEQARHGASHYVVFLVRPGAHEIFRAAATAFRKWRADFGCEPVDAGWRLAFGNKAADGSWPSELPGGGGSD